MKKAKIMMVQGTASSAGKSVIVTALCRIFRQDGYQVAPFKSQNMALNSFVTADGGEMGRAQVVQAEAAGIVPSVDMNPVLLKPTADTGCQVVVMGKVVRHISAGDYYSYTPSLLETVTAALERLRHAYDIVVIEGAGSPAEINLREREIVNMRIARLAGAPVLLVGDIDKGGVFASLVGTLELLEPEERDYVRGMIINKFRGDVTRLQDALDYLEKRTGRPVLGVVPYFHDIRIAQEDSVYLDERPNKRTGGDLDIAVVRLPHISNYDDFDPFEDEVARVNYVTRPDELAKLHLIVLPGTKATINDLEWLHQSGLAPAILARARSGTPVVGICGGYQILGKKILDPRKVESDRGEVDGLGLLDVITEFAPDKSTSQVRARVVSGLGLLAGANGQEVSGYEIHMGRTVSHEKETAFRVIETPAGRVDYPDGVLDGRGTVMGSYMHGLFFNDNFRHTFLNNLRRYWGLTEKPTSTTLARDEEYDKLAAIVRGNLDMPGVYRILEAGV